MKEATSLLMPGSRHEARHTSPGDVRRLSIVCICCSRAVIRAGGDGTKQVAHFRHYRKADDNDLCELRVASEIAERERGTLRPLRPTLPHGQSLAAFLARFEENVLRLNEHFHAGTQNLLRTMRLRPTFRRSVYLQRENIRITTLTGGTHRDDGHAIHGLLHRFREIMVETGETEDYIAVWDEGMTATLKFVTGPAAFPALLFAVSLGLVTALSKGMSQDPLSSDGVDMSQIAAEARLADFCMYSDLQFRAFVRERDFWVNSANIYSNSVMHSVIDFVCPLIAEHSMEQAA